MAATAQDQKMYVGIDVSKNRLDVHIHPSAEVFAVGQNAEGLEQLVKRLKDLDLAVIAMRPRVALSLWLLQHLQQPPCQLLW